MSETKNTILDDYIPRLKFACNIPACKGACCTLAGGTGAPLKDSELEQIDRAFPIIKSMLPAEHLNTISQYGLTEGKPGSYTTMCYDSHACVFVFYEHGIARCAFEKAFGEGKLQWKKPISCHLFPIRVSAGDPERLRYEKIDECSAALDRGQHENIFLSTFLREPLVRAYGLAWYEEFQRACNEDRDKQKIYKLF
ncbi:MAG: DUF3109 family protein [Ignavibacteriae bacterium]|nr:MAG: DUF3109 family protein [Ignavibacteriota bacterium]